MDPQQTPTPTTTTSTSTTATTSTPLQPPSSQPPPQPTPTTSTPTPTPTSSTPTPNPNPNPTPRPSPSVTTSTTRPPTLHQPWRHPHPHFQHFSSSTQPRGSVALGVPAASPSSFSTSFGQQFTGMSRSTVNVADSAANAGNSQVRPGMGMIGTTSAGSQLRAGGIHPQRPSQSSMRSPSPSPATPAPAAPRNFQGHSFMRSPSVGPSGSSASTVTSANQPWMNPASQPKPPVPSSSVYRSITPPSMHQRSVVPQQIHPLSTTSQQQVPSVQPQQPLSSHQSQEHYGQQFPQLKVSQSSPQPQQITRIQNLSNQKAPSPAAVQPIAAPTIQNRTIYAENDESSNRILSKRSIQELVTQIDPLEKLDPEVEDILADIADDFIESITTFGCSLAKHRKSEILEAKDILLHLERNWNMTLPGFSGDEIKTYRKPVTNDIHKERLAAIKRSTLASENANPRSTLGQAAGNTKGNPTKTPGNAMLPTNPKIREVTQGS